MSNSDKVRAFIGAWERRDLDAIVAAMAPDAVYHNIPMAPVRGREAIRAALMPFLAPAKEIAWEILAIAEDAQGRVLTERVDAFVFEGGKRLALPVMGVFEFKDGLISAWRDYWDMADFQKQMA